MEKNHRPVLSEKKCRVIIEFSKKRILVIVVFSMLGSNLQNVKFCLFIFKRVDIEEKRTCEGMVMGKKCWGVDKKPEL